MRKRHRRRYRARLDECGQAALWSVWACSVLISLVCGVLVWSAAVAARQRAETAADLAALAGAAAQVRGEAACPVAERVAREQGARLAACRPEPAGVSVVVEMPVPRPLRRLDLPPAQGQARAGVASWPG